MTQYIRLTLILVFGVIPALILSIYAGFGLVFGVMSLLEGSIQTGLLLIALSCLGLFGVYALCAAPMGATNRWQLLGLLAGIVAASAFVYFEHYVARHSSRLEPFYWALSPIVIAGFLLLEHWLKKLRTWS